MTEPKRTMWLIQVFDGGEVRFSHTVPVSLISEKAMAALLQHLAAQHLTPMEILDASVRRRSNRYRPLLEVRREPRERMILSVGENSHCVASTHTPEEVEEHVAAS